MNYTVDQRVTFELLDGTTAGKVLGSIGMPITLEAGATLYIVEPDSPVNGQKAVLVSSNFMKPLNCNWCRDTQEVAVTPFTTEQYDNNTIPTKPCPYCTPRPPRVL